MKLLIDYKTLIAIVFLIIGYLKSSIFIFLIGSIYFILYLIVITKSLLSKQKIISLDFILEEEELIARVENQQLMFSFSDMKAIKENKHSLIIKMNKKTGAVLTRFEIPYDLEGKHIEFIEKLEERYYNYDPNDATEKMLEDSIIAFKLDPKREIIRYIKYSRKIYFNIFISIICLFFSILLIDSKPSASIVLIALALSSWIGYYIDYLNIKSKKSLICSIEKLDDESLEIKGSVFKSIVKIKDIKLFNINNNEYIISVEGSIRESYTFTKNEIISGNIDNLIKVIGESYTDTGNVKQPLLPMIFAIISILCIPLVGIFDTPLGTNLLIAFNMMFFIVSLILAIIGLTKKDILKRFIYITLFLDFLMLIFYIFIISKVNKA